MKTVTIGCDHAGFVYKDYLRSKIEALGYRVIDRGTNSTDSVDYPDFVHPVAEDIVANRAECGIVICGSGNGVAMTANKHAEIRAAVAWNMRLAQLARQHNNANVLAIPARFVSRRLAWLMSRAFLETAFEGGRHTRRVSKIPPS